MNEYKKLDKTLEEDIEKVREFAAAKCEMLALKARVNYLQELLDENEELARSVWTTADNQVIAVHDLDDDHLKNIVAHIRNKGSFNKRIVAEYVKRFNEQPALPVSNYEDEDEDLFF